MPNADSLSSNAPSEALNQMIAIDGPVASGKTVVGRALAQRLHWQMLDTGIMYRALTWLALRGNISLDDPVALENLAATVKMRVEGPDPRNVETASIQVDSLDATPHLRGREVEAGVSLVARVPGVREQMVNRQREIAKQGQLVMVGRDIGTVVAPQAAVKIYLDAAADVRAQRRAAQMRENGRSVSNAEVLTDLRRRDAMDAGRTTSPLRADHHAHLLDTSHLSMEQVIEAAIKIVKQQLPAESLS